MKKIFILLGLVVIVAIASTFLTHSWLARHDTSSILPSDSIHEDHAWLHKQLQITAEQEAKLTPAEQRFAVADAAARTRLTAANRSLADALGKNTAYTSEVATAVDNVHVAQSELQKLALEHYFELMAVLTPEQVSKLRQLVRGALTTEAVLQGPAY